MNPWKISLLLLVCLLAGCVDQQTSSQISTDLPQTAEIEQFIPTPAATQPASTANTFEASRQEIPSMVTQTPLVTPTLLAASSPVPTLSPVGWQDLPVLPEIDPSMKDVYRLGLMLGNNPRAFSKVGDCGSTPAWFLGDFDRNPKYYDLGEYTYLEPAIQEFQGSYERTSLAAKAGFNAASVFSLIWSNREQCQPDETPLACEYRIQRPSFAFIMLGSNDVWHQDSFEPQMRQIIEYSLQHGVIPILSTKADNLEKDGSINTTIARLAQEYRVPLINYWRAVQSLPDQGLQDDAVHITWGPNRFNDPEVMQAGWPVRNLTSLQALDAAWRAVTDNNQE